MSVTLDSLTFPSIGLDNSGPLVTGPERIVGSNVVGSNVVGANVVGQGSSTSFGSPIPLALIVIVIIILAYYVLFASLGNEESGSGFGFGSGSNSESNNKTIELVLWGLFILLLLLNGAAYIFNFDVVASIKNIFSPITNIDIKVKERAGSGSGSGAAGSGAAGSGNGLFKKKEVFHVSNNKYNYEDAKAICSAYDGRLATYNELNDAYNNGADWCGYGWSEGQMALFPTQEEKWNKLQKIEGHEHDCGRPGINGGFIDNPKVQFGINCFGNKPDITAEDAESMRTREIYPKTKKEIMFDQKVDYWRTKLGNIIVSPFNSDNWSII
jgi:hypothetical protein